METEADEWNKVDIACPPMVTFTYSWEEDGEFIRNCLPILQNHTDGSSGFRDPHASFAKEFQFFTEVIKKRNDLRKERYFNILLKIIKCGKKLTSREIVEFSEKLHYVTESSKKCGGTIRLPTRQMFEYLLVVIYGQFQLLLTIDNLCLEAANIYLQNLKKGFDYWLSLLYLPVVARIRVLSLSYALRLANYYDELMPVIQHLKGCQRFNLNQSSSLTQDLRNHCKYKNEDLDIRNGTSGKVTSEILDIFKDSEEKDKGVDDIKLSSLGSEVGVQDRNDPKKNKLDIAKFTEHSKVTELDKETKNDQKYFDPKNVLDVKLTKKMKQISVKEKEDLLGLLDILKEDVETQITSDSIESSKKINNIDTCSLLVGVDSFLKTDDLGEIVKTNTVDNINKDINEIVNLSVDSIDNTIVKKKRKGKNMQKIVNKKKDLSHDIIAEKRKDVKKFDTETRDSNDNRIGAEIINQKKKVVECENSSFYAIGKKMKSAKKKKKLTHNSSSGTIHEGSVKSIVSDASNKVHSNGNSESLDSSLANQNHCDLKNNNNKSKLNKKKKKKSLIENKRTTLIVKKRKLKNIEKLDEDRSQPGNFEVTLQSNCRNDKKLTKQTKIQGIGLNVKRGKKKKNRSDLSLEHSSNISIENKGKSEKGQVARFDTFNVADLNLVAEKKKPLKRPLEQDDTSKNRKKKKAKLMVKIQQKEVK